MQGFHPSHCFPSLLPGALLKNKAKTVLTAFKPNLTLQSILAWEMVEVTISPVRTGDDSIGDYWP